MAWRDSNAHGVDPEGVRSEATNNPLGDAINKNARLARAFLFVPHAKGLRTPYSWGMRISFLV
jgi:hypothetical protein